MDPKPAAVDMPDLYRAVLDRVARIQADGQRDLANRIRADAIRSYSRAWDDRARRELTALLRRDSVGIAVQAATTARALRRRTVRAA
jgi:histone H3/H4